MADLPPIFYLNYENLSQEYLVREYQKDILHEVLKERFGVNSVFTFKNANEEEHPKKLKIKCIQCSQNLNSHSFVTSSTKVSREISKNKIELTFNSQDEKHNPMPWKINIESHFPVFFISTKKHLTKNEILKDSDIEINACYKKEKHCIAQENYDNEEEAQKAKAFLIGKAAKNYIRKNKELSSYKVKNPILIKREDLVKIVYRTESQLKIEVKGIAKENGAVGDIIRIDVMIGGKNHNMKKTKIKAIVKAPGEVEYVL